MTTSRQEGAARTRAALIDVGLQLAERTGLAGLSINLLVEEAQVSKGAFFHHFGDRATYLVELHRAFHDEIDEEIASAIADLAPGRERLLTGSTTYLDMCLRRRGVRALLLEARAERAIVDEVQNRNAALAKLCTADFKAIKRARPADSARLWLGLTVEAALVELDAGRRQSGIRAALAGFLRED